MEDESMWKIIRDNETELSPQAGLAVRPTSQDRPCRTSSQDDDSLTGGCRAVRVNPLIPTSAADGRC